MRRGKKKIQFLLAVVLLMSMALSLLPYSAFAAGNLSQEDAAYTEQEQETDKAIGGETGDGETGDGETGDGETGDGETGDGETGDGETGDGETGDGETGDGEIGDGETGDGEIVAEGEVEHTSDELLDERTAGPFKLSFAVPKEWEGNYTGIYVNAHLGSYNSDPWINKEMTYTGSDKDLGGMKVYEITLQNEDCKWDGYHTLQFQAKNGDSFYKQVVAINKTWTNSSVFADKLYMSNGWVNWDQLRNKGPFKLSFAVPSEWEGNYTRILVNAHLGSYDSDPWIQKEMTDTGKTVGGEKIYEITLQDGDCMWDGYHTLQFQAWNGDSWYAQQVAINNTWTPSDDFADKFYVANSFEDWSDWDLDNLKTYYYDARLSKLQVYKNEINNDHGAFPTTDQTQFLSIPKWNTTDVYFCAAGEGMPDFCDRMTLTPSGVDQDVYLVEIPAGYTQIAFSSFRMNSIDASFTSDNGDHGARTETLSLSDASGFTKPCFYGASNDPVVYKPDRRGGYWGEAYSLRNAGSPGGVGGGTRPLSSDIYYVNTSVFDFFSDYELNGDNRAHYPDAVSSGPKHRAWVSFRHLDQALSDYYRTNGEAIPIYVGHFQPAYSDWGYRFQDVAGILGLYGFDYGDQAGFMSTNNSTLDANGGDGVGKCAAQGLVYSTMGSGTVLTKSGNILPLFDYDFLVNGNNSKHTVLGAVFDNAAFPFTKEIIDGVEYWSFDCAQKSLALKYDASEGKYFFQDMGVQDWAHNTLSDGYWNDAGGYGFFPFNAVLGGSANASQYNFGYGLKMDIKFYVPDSGKIDGHDIKLNFAGDDDLWVFIDGKLVLDVGGSHESVSGSINFATKTVWVSGVKASQGGATPSGFTLSGDSTTEHTMTIFYMERGMWGSNLKLSFNFVDQTRLNVEKEVDASDVNSALFPETMFSNYPFAFELKNLATHYGTAQTSGLYTQQASMPDYGSAASGKMENAGGAKFTLTSGESTSEGTVGSNGVFTLLDGQKASFENQFRRGSYIGLKESLSDAEKALFETKWTMKDAEGNNVTSFGTGTSVTNPSSAPSMVEHPGAEVDDGRTEKIFNYDDTQDGTGINAYKRGTAQHQANSFVLRSYSKPDAMLGDTDLTVLYTNKVQVGSLSIEKQQAKDSAPLTGSFTFKVEFSNVGGLALEGEKSISTTVTIKAGEKATISGIPAGTKFTVTEVDIPAGVELVSIDGKSGSAVSGTIAANATSAHVFVNSKKDAETCSLTISKTVTGSGSKYIPFRFTITLKDADGAPLPGTFACEGVQSSITTGIDGKATFSLKHEQQLKITGLPKGVTYTVEEDDLSGSGYTSSVGGKISRTASGTLTKDVTLSFINDKRGGIATGDSADPRSLAVLLALGITGMLLTGLKLRRTGKRAKHRA